MACPLDGTIVLLATLLTGGDDYEILAAVPPANETGFQAAAAKAGVRSPGSASCARVRA
jgi:thiamine-monophosphate kinase